MSETVIQILDERSLADRLSDLVAKVAKYAENAKAQNTKRAYETDWSIFSSWCDKLGIQSLPASPETLRLFIADLAE